MARPPRRQPARNPSPSSAGVVPLRPVARDDADQAAAPQDELDRIADSLVEELAATLEEGGVLGADDRAALREQVELALRQQVEAVAAGQAVPAASAAASGRSEWLDTIEGLRENDVLTEEDANALIRQLDTILSPSQNKDVDLALEFGRRFQRDGQEQALAWFKAQLNGASTQSSPNEGAKPSEPPVALASAIVNSKSRRLRGPPRR